MDNFNNISLFIEQNFPEVYREEGPFFVEFIRQYYVWMETDVTSPVYQIRNYLANHDIDTTVDDFIVYFKEKYLKNIQLNTATNTKQLIKNSIDLYRSKGTESSIKLFFDLIFSAPSQVYYPGEDLFKLSDAQWSIPQYIEVSSNPINRLLVGRQITGVYSAATAFVERLVRRKVNNTYIEVLYISAVNGSFRTGEIITLSSSTTAPLSSFPVMLGSLISLDVADGGDGFSVGEVVTLDSRTGSQGKAVVQSLETITGIVDFELEDGGWGYTTNTSISVSNTVLQLANVTLQTTGNTTLYNRINTLVQPMANVQWYANTKAFAIGDTVYNYNANGSVRGVSTIISAEYGTSNTTLYYLLATVSGNSAPYAPMPYTYYAAGNTDSFMIYNAGWTDVTAVANFNGMSSNVSLNCIGTNQFQVGEYVNQISSNNQIFARAQVMGVSNVTPNSYTVKMNNLNGLFLTNFNLNGESSGASANVSTASFDLGISNVTHHFVTTPGNVLRETSNNSLFKATVIQIPFGSGAAVSYDSDLLNPQAVQINSNYLRDHIDVTLQQNWVNSASYGASLNNANLNSPVLGEALIFLNKTLGSIARLKLANPGIDYSYAPFAMAVDPLIAPMHLSDFVIRITNPTGVFVVNELVTQIANGAKGLVKYANTSEVHIRRLTFEDRWAVGNTSTFAISGQTSGFNAYVKEVTYDIDGIAGNNAVITTKVTSSNSAVNTMTVIDSGFNYRDGEEVRFSSLDKVRQGTAVTHVTSHGKAAGYYKTTSSFLSGDKYLQDGDYYQDFSYEIKSPITVDRYSDMLKNILHVSGTKAFSSILRNSDIDTKTETGSFNLTQANTSP